MPVDGIGGCSFTCMHGARRMLGREQHPTPGRGCSEEGMIEHGRAGDGDAAGGCWAQTTQQHPALPLRVGTARAKGQGSRSQPGGVG